MPGKGLGKNLYQFMKDKTKLTKVDVNEQNPQAIGFYEKLGFQTDRKIRKRWFRQKLSDHSYEFVIKFRDLSYPSLL